jgi:hypothetical protein
MTKARNFSAKVQIEFADRREMAQTPDPLRSLSGSREGSPYRAFNFADRVGASESLRQHMDIIDGIPQVSKFGNEISIFHLTPSQYPPHILSFSFSFCEEVWDCERKDAVAQIGMMSAAALPCDGQTAPNK